MPTRSALAGRSRRTALSADLAPALMLLPRSERRRARALGGHARALFERARCADRHQDEASRRQRLGSIERWHRLLLETLDGDPTSRRAVPEAIRAMARAEADDPWPRPALDALAEAARWRAETARPADADEAARASRHLAGALATAFVGRPLPLPVLAFGGALVRLEGLRFLGRELAADRCPLARAELPDDALAAAGGTPDLRAVVEAVRRECARLRADLVGVGRGLPDLTETHQGAVVYLLTAALRLVTEIEEADSLFLSRPPRLAGPDRLALLFQARWRGVEGL